MTLSNSLTRSFDRGSTVDFKKWVIYAGLPSFQVFGVGGGHIPTFRLLLYMCMDPLGLAHESMSGSLMKIPYDPKTNIIHC